MDIFHVLFPISGVKTWVFLPPLVALVVSTFTSMAGVSGAFILLPFQMSFLGFTSPAVSSTNFVYNIVAIPSGVYRYFKEGRMAWPLTWVVIVGTLPGVFIGYYLRILYLPDPRTFKLFVGLVLLYIGSRLLYEITGKAQESKAKMNELDKKFSERAKRMKEQRKSQTAAGLPPEAVVKTITFNLKIIEYEFWGERFRFSVPAMFLLAFVVGYHRRNLRHRRRRDHRTVLRGRIPSAGLHGGGRGTARYVPHLDRRGLLLQRAAGCRRDIDHHRTGHWGSSSASAALPACISAHVSRNSCPRSSSSSCSGS